MTDKNRYPIGTYKKPKNISNKDISRWIQIIEEFPKELFDLVNNLTNSQLDTCYRKNGWTIRQVIHHCADSHHNSYTRFKWALTEDEPLIKAYYEERWAELTDGKTAPIELSLNYISGLHAKWAYFLKKLTDKELERTFVHPENKNTYTLKENIGIYAWHCKHHYAHINRLLKRNDWV